MHEQTLEAWATQLRVAVSSYSSVLVLYVYDYLLNLSREMEHMWPGPFCLATVLYFTTRYFPFVKLFYDLITVYDSASPTPPKGCAVALHIVNVFHILSRTSITVVLFAQTYAVYQQSRVILFTLGPLGVALIVIDGIESSVRACTLQQKGDRKIHTMLSLTMLTAFPTAVLGLTLWRIITIIRKERRPASGINSMIKGCGLTKFILFESVCMSGVCMVRLFNALWFILAPTTFNLGVNPFALPAAAIFISHFFLSLRDMHASPRENSYVTTHPPAFTTWLGLCPTEIEEGIGSSANNDGIEDVEEADIELADLQPDSL